MGQRYWTRATRALLHRSASLTGMIVVMGTFPIRRSRAGSLVRDRRGRAVMRLEEGVRCKAVAGRGSRGGVGGRGVDVLHGQTEVQVRQAHASAPVWRRHAGRGGSRVYLCKPTAGGVAAGRAHAVSVGSQSFANGVSGQILRGDRFAGWGDLDPGADSLNGQWSRHHTRWVEWWGRKVFRGGEVLSGGQWVRGGHVLVMVDHQ